MYMTTYANFPVIYICIYAYTDDILMGFLASFKLKQNTET